MTITEKTEMRGLYSMYLSGPRIIDSIIHLRPNILCGHNLIIEIKYILSIPGAV